jgi:hypothetical protein
MKEYKKLGSYTTKINAVKLQIKIHVIGFGWKDLHHPWSKEGRAYTADELFKYLTNILIPEQKRRGIPDSPTMDLPARKYTPQLGTRTAGVDRLDERYGKAKDKAIAEAVAMRDKLQDEGVIDWHEKLQPAWPEVDEDLIGAEMKFCTLMRNQTEALPKCGVRARLLRCEQRIEFILNGMLVPFVKVMNQLLRRHY